MLNRLVKLLSSVVLLTTALAHAQKPALTQNIDEKGRVPFQQSSTAGGCTYCSVSMSIPAGQRLVVTNVSVYFVSKSDPGGIYVEVDGGGPLPTGSGVTYLYLPLTYAGTRGGVMYVCNSQVTLYADGQISLNIETGATANFLTTVSGYLVPLPS